LNFTTPEFIDGRPHDCKDCGVHVKCGRALSWEFGFCPKCYEPERNRIKSKPMNTIINPAVINPMTVYLNLYTPREMENV
jgi:hypothetical protein